MSEHKDENARSGWLQKGNRKVIAIATVTALAVAGAFGVQAFADSPTYAHMKQFGAGNHGEGWGRGHRGEGWGSGRHGRFADMSDPEMQAHIERMVKHVAIEIDATPEQTGKITVLLTSLAKDMKPLRDDMHATGQQIRDLLLSDSVDRAALEKVRSERLAEADRVSKNLVDKVAEIAEVLTPEQRKVLSERIDEFRGMRGRWHRG
jgi:Spy/CpxP family protein refolding chaperone